MIERALNPTTPREPKPASTAARADRALAWAGAWLLPWLVLGLVLVGNLPSAHLPLGLGLVGLLAMGILFIRGLEGAPEGWGAWPYTFALAAALAEFLLGARGMVEGYLDARREVDGLVAGARPAPAHDPYALVNAVAVTLVLGLLFHRLLVRRREARAQARLLEQARAQALQSKLAPHFIFNTLNTLHAQIDLDPREAQATTERLAGLFRQLIAVVDRPTIPLKEELAFVEAYLGIEKVRLGDRLAVRITVPEELEGCEIPPLSLQVLVENAVKHGVAPLEQGGEVRISAKRIGDHLTLCVEDPGAGEGAEPGTGTALETLRQRLARPEDLQMGAAGNRHRVSFQWRLG